MNINREEALRRLNSPGNLANSLGRASSRPDLPVDPLIEHRVPVVRKPRGEAVPPETRDAIARVALEGRVPQRVIAESYGVNQKTVSNYKTNHIGNRPPTEARKEEHRERVNEVRDTALTKLMGALGLIDGAKLENLEAKDLGKLAKDMASVYSSLGPKDTGNAGPPINLIVYSPEIRPESKYKVLDV